MKKIGYEVYRVSNEKGQGLEEVRTCLKDKISVLAGQSGVGKSSLIGSFSNGMKKILNIYRFSHYDIL
ncbi:MAG: GTPase RsgA [Desulfitobacteriaceae bacterium]